MKLFNVKQYMLYCAITKIFLIKTRLVLTNVKPTGYNNHMKIGLIADIVVAIFILISLIICTHRGFIRCLMSSVSSVLAFAVAVFASAPLANLCESKFGWEAAIAKWNVPFVSAHTLLRLMVGIAIFIAVRLVCIILDKILQALKKKLKAVGVIDRILGTVFGAFSAMVELTLIFMFIASMNWAANVGLTADCGGYFAYRLFDFCQAYLFNIVQFMMDVAAATTPKI